MLGIEELPLRLAGCVVDEIERLGTTLIINAHSIQSNLPCPDCAVCSGSIHSTYERYPQALPCLGYGVQLVIQVQRFRCHNPGCQRQTFAETLPEVVPLYGRRTVQVSQVMEKVGLEVGAEAGVRILKALGIRTSGDTLLRVLRHQPLRTVPTPRVLGLDDWAFKRGKQYGTLLVDLEQHQVIDVLPDREAETVSQWLEAHPGIEIASRDRAGSYAKALASSAPDVIQVADRWHLLKNLGDAVQQFLKRYTPELCAVAQSLTQEVQATEVPFEPLPLSITPAPALPDPRLPSFQAVKVLHAQGLAKREIARRLQLHRRTVTNYINAETLPQRSHTPNMLSTATPYLPYLRQRWAEGCQNVRKLWREICGQGFTGSQASVYRVLRPFYVVDRRRQRETRPLLPPVQRLSARQAMWLLLHPSEKLDAEQIRYRDLLLVQAPVLKTVYTLVQRFTAILKQRQAEQLDQWLQDAQNTGISVLQSFAKGILQDYAAVKAAFSTEWNNGQIEGQVNRLKFIKRQMYGRAKFDLLRRRVLYQLT